MQRILAEMVMSHSHVNCGNASHKSMPPCIAYMQSGQTPTVRLGKCRLRFKYTELERREGPLCKHNVVCCLYDTDMSEGPPLSPAPDPALPSHLPQDQTHKQVQRNPKYVDDGAALLFRHILRP